MQKHLACHHLPFNAPSSIAKELPTGFLGRIEQIEQTWSQSHRNYLVDNLGLRILQFHQVNLAIRQANII
ncbi:MAG: hypothetical protein P4L50_24105 [Anaerolineaceae bacterium]|nr:hypothetical protein [Anaerolineaceae bacterium]